MLPLFLYIIVSISEEGFLIFFRNINSSVNVHIHLNQVYLFIGLFVNVIHYVYLHIYFFKTFLEYFDKYTFFTYHVVNIRGRFFFLFFRNINSSVNVHMHLNLVHVFLGTFVNAFLLKWSRWFVLHSKESFVI